MPNILEALDSALRSGEDVRPIVAAFHQLALGADAETKNRMLESLDAPLRAHPGERTGDVAVLAGAFVEIGADPRRFPGAVFDRLVEVLDRVPGDDEERPDWFHLYVRAAIACLSRSSELRRVLPQRQAIVDRLRHHRDRHGFLGKMIQVLDDEAFVVLHPSTGRGFRFRMHGIADNFQLHALLLGALGGDGPNRIGGPLPTASALAAARDGEDVGRASVESTWQLANWFALRPGGAIDQEDMTRSWIWNEGVPADIAVFDGTRIVLVGEATFRRGWNAQRVFPGMIARLDGPVMMEPAEAHALLSRLEQATRPS